MGRTLQQSVVEPTYLEFFGLSQPPFAGLCDLDKLFDCEQYSVLMQHLANAAATNDSLVVVCGADGSGKSTLLRRFLTGVTDSINCVVIDETCHSEEAFYLSFLNQIGFADISGTAHELENITKEFLVCRGIAGDNILITIDNAHLADPIVLEQLQLLCAIKTKDQRVLSVVLTGTADIVRIVNAPAMSKIKFRNHTVFSIRNFSVHETAGYIWHRLRLAGCDEGIELPDEASALIHRYSGGTPQRIDFLCNEILEEAYKLNTHVLGAEVVRTIADRQQLMPQLIPLHGRGRRKTDPDSGQAPALADTARDDNESLRQQVAKLSEQVDNLGAYKARALEEIEVRNRDIIELRKELDTRGRMLSDLEQQLKRTQHDYAVAKHQISLLKSPEELEQAEKTSTNLAADLAKEAALRAAADNELAEATANVRKLSVASQEVQEQLDDALADLSASKSAADELSTKLELETAAKIAAENELQTASIKVDELDALRRDLQAIIRDLNGELEEANERAIGDYMLQRNIADLEEALEAQTRELDARNQAFADIERQLDASQKECASLLRQNAFRQDAAPDTTSEKPASTPRVVELFEQSIEDQPAYKLLKNYDQSFYDHLIATYKRLAGQGLTEKQINDAMRTKLARKMEQLLPNASNKAIIAYGRLIIDELDELQLDGVEPCLQLLVPASDPEDGSAPVFSDHMRERELETLVMTLESYKANRQPLERKDVWPDVEPVFRELFAAFGVENVAAMENSYDPDIDRILVCNVSRALYSGVLNLPKRRAANALRWLISP